MPRFVPILFAILVSCSKPAPEHRIRIATHRDPIAFLPLAIAEKQGYFREEHLTVTTDEMPGGSKALEALIGGSADVAAASMSDALTLAAVGRDVQSFLVMYTRPMIALAVSPPMTDKIHSLPDLKGHTVGVSTRGSASEQFLNYLLATNHLKADDVAIVAIGMSAASIAAVEHHEVDAAILIASAIPNFESRQPGAVFLCDTRTPEGTRKIFGSEVYPSLSLLANTKWLADRDTAARLVRAVKKGMQWEREHSAMDLVPLLPPGSDLAAIQTMQAALSPDGQMPSAAFGIIQNFTAVSNEKVLTISRAPYTNDFVK